MKTRQAKRRTPHSESAETFYRTTALDCLPFYDSTKLGAAAFWNPPDSQPAKSRGGIGGWDTERDRILGARFASAYLLYLGDPAGTRPILADIVVSMLSQPEKARFSLLHGFFDTLEHALARDPSGAWSASRVLLAQNAAEFHRMISSPALSEDKAK